MADISKINPNGIEYDLKDATARQDLSLKADKVSGATSDDFVTLDSNGNLTDSGINSAIVPSGATLNNKLATANDIPTELNDLSDDVVITSPQNAQVLTYNSTSGKWENQTGSAPIGGAVFKGSILFANIPTTGMVNGDWYDIKDEFTTDNRFEEGAGIACAAGTDIIWVSADTKWNILTPSGVYSFNGRTGAVSPASGDYTKSDVGLGNVVNTGDSATPVNGGTTKFTTGGAYIELNKKANKVSSPTNGNFAGLDANGNLTDSGKKASDFLPSNTPIPSTDNCYQSTDTAETTLADDDYFPFYDTSASGKRKTLWSNIKSKLGAIFVSNVSISNGGSDGTTPTAYDVVWKQLEIEKSDSTMGYILDGTEYMQQNITLSTSAPVSATFTNGEITANSIIEVYAGRSTGDVQGAKNQFPYDSVYTTAGSCVVTFPKESSAITITVRIYIRG